MKRLTYKQVKQSFADKGYILLSKEYVNSYSNLKYKCSKGHVHKITWTNWQQGKRCPQCSSNAKLTLDQVKQIFAQEGYILESKEYKNNKSYLEYKCPKGHYHKTSWSNWQQGNRCPSCYGNVKLTYEQVKQSFTDKGYILLSKEYVNNKQYLEYKCPKGHVHKVKWMEWQRGCRCPKCSKYQNRYTLDQIKQSFTQEGYKLITKEYKGAQQYLKYKCLKGHVHKTKWNYWQQDRRCPDCAKDKKKHTYEHVKQSFAQEGYKLISKEYVNNNSYLKYECPKGHKHKITWHNWQQNRRCPHCAGKAKLTYDFVKQSFAQEGYTLLSKEYKGANNYLRYKCPKGHIHKIKWANWQQGRRCPTCAHDEKKLTYDFVKQSFAQEGYELKSEKYKSSNSHLEYECPKGHVHRVTWGNWQQGCRCGICHEKWSKAEKEIVNYIKKIYNGTVIENDRSLIVNPETGCNLEFDIWLPDINKAIEYNGYFWHNTDEAKAKDTYKQQWCKDNNIDLLVINEQDWLANKDWDMVNQFINERR